MKTIEKNEKGFRYFEMVAGSHDHQKTRVWVNQGIPLEEERLSFPVCGARIALTEKGALVMRPCDGQIVYLVEVESGYRGSADIHVEGKKGAGGSNASVMAEGKSYHSPQGNLGETAWALVNADGEIVITGRRTGRRINKVEVAFTLHGDGRVEEEAEEGLNAALMA